VVAVLELGIVLLAFGGMATFFAWTARRERRRVHAAAQAPMADRSEEAVLVLELDGVSSSRASSRRIVRVSRAA
jgi:hypothetical protein